MSKTDKEKEDLRADFFSTVVSRALQRLWEVQIESKCCITDNLNLKKNKLLKNFRELIA